MSVKTYEYINLDYMDMMSDGDASMKKVMLEMLLEELPAEMDKMKACQEESKWFCAGKNAKEGLSSMTWLIHMSRPKISKLLHGSKTQVSDLK